MKKKVVIYASAVAMLLFGFFCGHSFPNLVWLIVLLELTSGIGFGYYLSKITEAEVQSTLVNEKDVEISSLKTANSLMKHELERKKEEINSIKKANSTVKKEKKTKKVEE